MIIKRRFAALMLAILIIAAMITSLFIIIHEADHDCIGEGCPNCAVVSICQNIIKTFTGTLIAFAVAVSAYWGAVYISSALKSGFHTETLVSLKIKLLN